MNNWNENINHHSIMIIIKTTKITRIDRILKSVFSKPHLVQGSILEPNRGGEYLAKWFIYITKLSENQYFYKV